MKFGRMAVGRLELCWCGFLAILIAIATCGVPAASWAQGEISARSTKVAACREALPGRDDGAVAASNASSGVPVTAGRFSVTVPAAWQVVSGAEEAQLRAELETGIDQVVARYRDSTGSEHPPFGIRGFMAMRLPGECGWCVLYLFRIPEQSDYYAVMESDTKQKIEWGMSQGIFESVVENGKITIGKSTVMKTILRQKSGGRMISISHWSPDLPSDVSQLVVLESKLDSMIQKQIDEVIRSLKVMNPDLSDSAAGSGN